jgi:hypothetical protein
MAAVVAGRPQTQ